MKPYGQKRDWAESEMTNKSRTKKVAHSKSKKKTKFWKKRERQKVKKEINLKIC